MRTDMDRTRSGWDVTARSITEEEAERVGWRGQCTLFSTVNCSDRNNCANRMPFALLALSGAAFHSGWCALKSPQISTGREEASAGTDGETEKEPIRRRRRGGAVHVTDQYGRVGQVEL